MSSFWFKRALCALTLTVAMLCIVWGPVLADEAEHRQTPRPLRR
jgi:hypothetical protein